MNETPIKQSRLSLIHSILEHNPEFSIEYHLFSDLLSSKRRNIDNTYFYQPDSNASKIFSFLLNKITYYESINNLNCYYISLPDLATQTKTGLGTVKRKILKLKNLNWIDVQIKKTSKGSTLCHFSINPEQFVNDFNEYNLRIKKEQTIGVQPDINALLDDTTEVDNELLKYKGLSFNDETFAEYQAQEELKIIPTIHNQEKDTILFAHILSSLNHFNSINNTKTDTVCLDHPSIATSLSWSIRTVQRQIIILKQKKLITTIVKHNFENIPKTYFTIKSPTLIIEKINSLVTPSPQTVTLNGVEYPIEQVIKLAQAQLQDKATPKIAVITPGEVPVPTLKKQYSKIANLSLEELKQINLTALKEYKDKLFSKPINSQDYITNRFNTDMIWDKQKETASLNLIFDSIETYFKNKTNKKGLTENPNIQSRFNQFADKKLLAWSYAGYNTTAKATTPTYSENNNYDELFSADIQKLGGVIHTNEGF